jgi:hypothetical protein
MVNRWVILQRMPRDFKSEADQFFRQASALKLRGEIKGAIDKDKRISCVHLFLWV